MAHSRLTDLLLQSLQHEMGGVLVYETAIQCAQNRDLRSEWERYLEQTRRHVEILESICERLGVDARQPSPGRDIVDHVGQALVQAMQKALAAGNAQDAELVACECVVLAETKDHMNWELLGKCAETLLRGEQAEALQAAHAEVEEQEDEHLYHTKGWCRELWLDALGLKALLPPPEETRDVKTAIGAARAIQASEKLRV